MEGVLFDNKGRADVMIKPDHCTSDYPKLKSNQRNKMTPRLLGKPTKEKMRTHFLYITSDLKSRQ
jgi:hypothetical protein